MASETTPASPTPNASRIDGALIGSKPSKLKHRKVSRIIKHAVATGLVAGSLTGTGLAVEFNHAFGRYGITAQGSVLTLLKNRGNLKTSFIEILADSEMPLDKRVFLTKYVNLLKDITENEGITGIEQRIKIGLLPTPDDVYAAMANSDGKFTDLDKRYHELFNVIDTTNREQFQKKVKELVNDLSPNISGNVDIATLETTVYSKEDLQHFADLVNQYPELLKHQLDILIVDSVAKPTGERTSVDPLPQQFYSRDDIDFILNKIKEMPADVSTIYMYELNTGLPEPELLKQRMEVILSLNKYIQNRGDVSGLGNSNLDTMDPKIKQDLYQQLVKNIFLYTDPNQLAFLSDSNNFKTLLDYCETFTGDKLAGSAMALQLFYEYSINGSGQVLCDSLASRDALVTLLQSGEYSLMTNSKFARSPLLIFWLRAASPLSRDYLTGITSSSQLILESQADKVIPAGFLDYLAQVLPRQSEYLATFYAAQKIVGPTVLNPIQIDRLFGIVYDVTANAKVNLQRPEDFQAAGIDIQTTSQGIVLIPTNSHFQITHPGDPETDEPRAIVPLILHGINDEFISWDGTSLILTQDLESKPIAEVMKHLSEDDYLWEDNGELFIGKCPTIQNAHPANIHDLVVPFKNFRFLTRVLPVDEQRIKLPNSNKGDHFAYLEGNSYSAILIIKDGRGPNIFESYVVAVPDGTVLNADALEQIKLMLKVQDDEEVVVLLSDIAAKASIRSTEYDRSFIAGGEVDNSISLDLKQ